MDEPISIERQAGFILTDLKHLINYARGCARTMRAGDDIDNEGIGIVRSLRALFTRLNVKPDDLSKVIATNN